MTTSSLHDTTTDIVALRHKFRRLPDQLPRTPDDQWEHPADHWDEEGE